MYKVKLTVLKTAIYPELAEKYLSIGKELKPCGGFNAVPMRHGQKRMVWKSAAVQTASDR